MFKVDSAGTLTAMNAKISGEIIADSGEIGGFILEDNMLKATDGSGGVAAILNGGSTYQEGNVKLIFASGISNINNTGITANTKIYSNGSIETSDISITGGVYEGFIDAGGRFYGELDNCNGTLNYVSITNGNYQGNINLLSSDTLDVGGLFNVSNNKVGAGESNRGTATIDTIHADDYYYQNKSGNEYIYTRTVTLASFRVSRASTIEIPQITVNPRIFCVGNKKIPYQGYVNIICACDGGTNKRDTLLNINIPKGDGISNEYKSFSGVSQSKSFSVEASTTISLTLKFYIPLSSHNLWNYPAFRIEVTPSNSISYSSENGNGFMIGSDGWLYTNQHGTSIGAGGVSINLVCGNSSVSKISLTNGVIEIGGVIRLNSPSGAYGISLDDNGIRFIKGEETLDSWT